MAKAKSAAAKSNGVSKVTRSNAQKPLEPVKALPVTLLSGFLGSGKTTLLQHILRSEHGLRIAVIVNDIGAVNVDANLIRNTHRVTKTEEKVIALQNGCICCTLRGDLLEELVRLAEIAEFDYIIVESSGISEPEQVAETFDSRLAEQISEMGNVVEGLDESTLATLQRLKEAGGLEKFARLDTTCTVIDAFTMFHDFETTDLLSSRRDDVTPEDERTVSDLMVDQIEFADVIVLNKIDRVDKEMRERVRTMIKKLNHRAKIIESSYGKIDVKEIVNTGMFNLEVAQTGYGWLQDLHAMTIREVNGRKMVTPKPETEEYNVRNFVYVRRRPFSPRRLFELLHDKFILQHPIAELDEEEGEEEEEEEEDESMEDASDSDNSDEDEEDEDEDATMTEAPELPSDATILANKRAHPLFAKLFRSKGEFWLATRPHRAGEWSQAGAMLTLAGGRPWFCTIDRSEWETGTAEIDKMVEHDIKQGGKWGDRRQELVFIGEKLDVEAIEKVLDECLLNDKEWKQWCKVMEKGSGPNSNSPEELEKKMERLAGIFDDGFPDWDDEEDHDHGAGHGHGGDAVMKDEEVDLERKDSHSPKRNGAAGAAGAAAAGGKKAKHGVRKDGTVY
ncbi:Putative metal chaperone [Fulvia fulva]|uniref:Metal chaperone n=1 Tax=Passalora fulva TaxID=5499 RepID=A0A9Q8P9N4_PASFU|nr:Putative metal chaperone [Fulvia fulva]KAK4621696.1 putative metal chaperone [Fulvia fulva]KAK4623303.1 putative metal chaperone [Fulvia fulva]UJO18480.1 Putative metal chaperone [Fulvia fulva]WPV16537.1 Putative metal chaperone [Fulvia fulva]WPV30959.1 Putative metal chaperone [Fulvia fulva]